MPYAHRDGVALYYERDGSGEPELLFVPGWCCNGSFFAPQLDHFGSSHAVTVVELRGCGRSDLPESGYDIPSLADDVAQSVKRPRSQSPLSSATAWVG